MSDQIAKLTTRIDTFTSEYNLSNYDIWSETGRSVTEHAEFKEKLIKFYGRGFFFSRAKIKCMGTDISQSREFVIASRIWSHGKHGVGLAKFNLQKTDATSPRNGLLMLKDIQKQFDVKGLCFIYDAIAMKFKVKILNPCIGDDIISNSDGLTFRRIDGKVLQHPIGKLPYRRILSFHAQCALRNAREKNWIEAREEESFQPFHDLSDSASVPEF